MILSMDFETRSVVDLPDCGLDVYSSHPSTEIICLAAGYHERTVSVWAPEDVPEWVFEHIRSGGKVSAWNAGFELCIWNRVGAKLGWPELKIEQVIDSMAIAAANNLPQDLDTAGEVLNSEFQKDKRGKKLIQLLSKPNKEGKFNKDPDLLKEMFDYCRRDVQTEMSIVKGLRPLSPEEQTIWELTQRINARGVSVDVEELKRMVEVVDKELAVINAEIKELTGGIEVTKREQLLKWFHDHGLKLPNMQAETVERAAAEAHDDPTVARVLSLRAEGAKTSVSKFAKMLEMQVDGRIRNGLVYHGASTGRWASRGINLQNIARPAVWMKDADIEDAVELALVGGDYGGMRARFGAKTMEACASIVRNALKAPDGFVYVDADLSSIENRVAAWVAHQDDKLELFRQGLDEYKTFASTSLYNVPYEEVTKDMRQVSKSAVLGCFGADTRVVTKEGLKRIVDVTPGDYLWDGVEWVKSDGAAFMGHKWVIDLVGVQVTPDHLVLTEEGWQEAQKVDLKSALALADGLSSGIRSIVESFTPQLGVIAATNEMCRSVTFAKGKAPSANLADFRQPGRAAWRKVGTMSCRTPKHGKGGSTAGLQQSHVATIQKTPNLKIMGAGVFMCAKNGETALQRFLDSSKGCWATMTPQWSLTGSTTMGRTRQKTCALHQEPNSATIRGATCWFGGKGVSGPPPSFGANLQTCTEAHQPWGESSGKVSRQNKSSWSKPVAEVPTYDVINCGPRNRFTILTSAGPLIVHNCMYGQGGKGLVAYAAGMGVTLELELAETAVQVYRQDYAKVKNCWYAMGQAAIDAIKNPGTAFRAGRVLLKVSKGALWMQLPSGRLICWQKPEVRKELTPWGKMAEMVYVFGQNTFTRKWGMNKLIGSSIFQSSVQGIARDFIAEPAWRLDRDGVLVVNLVHDEILALARVEEAKEVEQKLLTEMTTPPVWAPNFPLAAESWISLRYRK